MGVCDCGNSDEKAIQFLPEAKKAICQVEAIDKSKNFYSGFFCKIPSMENNNILFPSLITNSHILEGSSLDLDGILTIFVENEVKFIPMSRRKRWTNKTIDYACIEINEEEDDIHTFFNLDNIVLDNNYSNDYYLNQKVVIFSFNKNNKEIGFSNGLITKNKDSFFEYSCNNNPGYSGGCIVNKSNNCVIGIHQGEINTQYNNNTNQGVYIKSIIKSIITDKSCYIPRVIYFIYYFYLL